MSAKKLDLSHITIGLHGLAVSVSDLKLDPSSARLHNKRSIDTIAASLEQFGQDQPLVVQREGLIVRKGNGRLRAARQLGWRHIAAIVLDESDVYAIARSIADNRSTEFASWDERLLAELLETIQLDDSLDVDVTGFFDEEIEELLRVLAEDRGNTCNVSSEPLHIDPHAVPVTKPGDLWLMGKHRLLCGDATSTDDVKRLMKSKKADMAFSDPPYNMNYQSDALGGIENDALGNRDFVQLIMESTERMMWSLRNGGSYYICMGAAEYPNVFHQLRKLGLRSRVIIWVKPSLGLGAQEYRPQFETILFGVHGDRALRTWNGGRRERDLWEFRADGVVARKRKSGGTAISVGLEFESYEIKLDQDVTGKVEYCDGTDSDIWRFGRESGIYQHPTQKPIELVKRAITNSSQPGDLVIDFFCGSGTTLAASVETDRLFRGIELDTRYCDVAVQRWEAITGKKAKRSP